MTELTKEELVRAGSAHLQSKSWLPMCCMFPKGHLLSEGCSTNTRILVIHLAVLPFHHRIELGFQVNKPGCEWLSSCNTLLREFSSFFQSSFPFSLPISFSSTPTSSCLFYPIIRPETTPVSLLPQRDTSFILLLKQIKQSFPFPWATCSKLQAGDQLYRRRQIPFEQLIQGTDLKAYIRSESQGHARVIPRANCPFGFHWAYPEMCKLGLFSHGLWSYLVKAAYLIY